MTFVFWQRYFLSIQGTKSTISLSLNEHFDKAEGTEKIKPEAEPGFLEVPQSSYIFKNFYIAV